MFKPIARFICTLKGHKIIEKVPQFLIEQADTRDGEIASYEPERICKRCNAWFGGGNWSIGINKMYPHTYQDRRNRKS